MLSIAGTSRSSDLRRQVDLQDLKPRNTPSHTLAIVLEHPEVPEVTRSLVLDTLAEAQVWTLVQPLGLASLQ